MEELRQKAEKYANDKADKGNYDYVVGDNVFFGKSALEKAYIAGATEVTEELQEENKYLKEALECAEHNCKVKQEYNDNQFNAIMKYREKAKEIIQEFMRISTVCDDDFEPDYSVLIDKAEEFLREEEEK